jgi:integrase
MVDGQRIHRVIGRESDGTTRTQAEAFIEKARRDAREGRLSLPKGRKVALSLSDAAAIYLERLRKEGGKDIIMKERRFRVHLMPFFTDTPMSKISTFQVERYKKHRVDQGAKVGTVNRELAALSHLFTKALAWQWIDKRPTTIIRFQEERGRIAYLTAEQANRLIQAAMEDQNPQMYPFVLIGLGTGMRKAEILSIRPEHVVRHDG